MTASSPSASRKALVSADLPQRVMKSAIPCASGAFPQRALPASQLDRAAVVIVGGSAVISLLSRDDQPPSKRSSRDTVQMAHLVPSFAISTSQQEQPRCRQFVPAAWLDHPSVASSR